MYIKTWLLYMYIFCLLSLGKQLHFTAYCIKRLFFNVIDLLHYICIVSLLEGRVMFGNLPHHHKRGGWTWNIVNLLYTWIRVTLCLKVHWALILEYLQCLYSELHMCMLIQRFTYCRACTTLCKSYLSWPGPDCLSFDNASRIVHGSV